MSIKPVTNQDAIVSDDTPSSASSLAGASRILPRPEQSSDHALLSCSSSSSFSSSSPCHFGKARSSSTSTHSSLTDLSSHQSLPLNYIKQQGQIEEGGQRTDQNAGGDPGLDQGHSHEQEGEEQHEEQEEENKMNIKSASPEIDPVLEDWKAKGRRGDPRMHKAVAARLEKPDLSLFQALVIGGFKFPDTKEKTKKNGRPQGPIYDSDNILLSQRKNQLSRRLRLHARKKLKGQKHLGMDVAQKIQHDAAMKTILIANTFNFAQQNGGGYPACFLQHPVANDNKRGAQGHAGVSNSSAYLAGLLNAQQNNNLLLNSIQNQGHQSPLISPTSGITLSDNHSAALQLDLMNLQQQQQKQQQEHLALRSLAGLSSHGTSSQFPATLTTTNYGPFCNQSNLLSQTELMASSHLQNHQLSTPTVNPFVSTSVSQKAAYDQMRLQQAMILHQKAEIEQLKTRQALSEANLTHSEAAEVKRQYENILSDFSGTIANF
eukprot:CAMPEP_0203651760 /NCGR_PEP_ID=MMETSP0088-20131115/28310_1 /ASSEMBLY_ACC=CAM_ASM_001087 /TAXON_ID=426623 /ORGANISM="Chaetoceros affinis, Strain CCMP159" /LENGTH=489 /DNA_ID=CAMNT_0050511031 /DNA_START=74 /DNA_END=1543 /DNA_ORIENTATION=-